MFEKILESLLDSKDMKQVHSKGNQLWIRRTDAEAEAPILWPPDAVNSLEKTLMLGQIEGRRRRGLLRMRWSDDVIYSMDVNLRKTPGDGEGHGGLVCCSPWGCKESDTTEWLNWTELMSLPGESHGQRSLVGNSPVQFSSVAPLCPTLCNPMDHSMPGLLLHHQFLEHTQTQVHWVGDDIQPSHPLSSTSPPTFSLSQHQGLFQWVSSSHQVAKVLEFQL